jgi:ubiquinone/menaquinone biosynthesis C-methylase UbiE
MMKPTTTSIRFAIEDVEKFSFKDNQFDTVIDTFGLEYNVFPERAISEMKRVCRKVQAIAVAREVESCSSLPEPRNMTI